MSISTILILPNQAKLLFYTIICLNLILNVACGHSFGESFDFVVVGGGVAGCSIAERLSENLRFTVLLLEAGPVPHPSLDVPALGDVDQHVKIYQSVPQDSLQLGNGTGRVINYIVGRTLGGGSSVNGMVFNRGSPFDYDNWSNLTGDSSWKYKNMMPFFKRVENYQGDFPSDQHGYSGHITVSRPKYAPGMRTVLEAGAYLGYPIADQNGPQKRSFTPLEFSKRFGRRVSSFTGYLKPYLDTRRNLKIITGATVEQIIFERSNRGRDVKAVGVKYSQTSGRGAQQITTTHFVGSKREIIVSAGVMESPSILMRSGIGPKDNLDKAGIQVVRELPVGKDLGDHLVVRLNFMIIDSTQVLIPERDLTPANHLKYNLTGDGPYSTHDADNAQAFMVSNLSEIAGWPDIQIQFISSGRILAENIPEDIRPGEVITSCILFVSRPKSRGRLMLNYTNPVAGDPIIDFQFMSDPQDMEVYLEGIEKTLQVYERTPAFQRVGARYSGIPIKECRHVEFRSREYWKCFIVNRVQSGLHAGGTCKMGRGQRDPTAVVDPELKVIGVEGLRVADSSVMPQVTNANTQAAVYAIAEKASQLIWNRWRNEQRTGEGAQRDLRRISLKTVKWWQ